MWSVGCGRGTARGEKQPGTLHARLTRTPRDTVRFVAAAEAHRCGAGTGILLKGTMEGNGVLVWARSGDSVTSGDYPLLTRGDSTTARGAMVAVRIAAGPEGARGVTLDSGSVTLVRAGGRIGVEARGTGFEPRWGKRVELEALFDSVPLAADTVSCLVTL